MKSPVGSVEAASAVASFEVEVGTKDLEREVGWFGLDEFGLDWPGEESGVSGKTGARFSGKKGAGAGEGECLRRTGRIQAGETLAYSGT